jgi:hypothetical protein
MPLDAFVHTYALMISTRTALQFGLLLADGNSIEVAGRLACSNNPESVRKALDELCKLGFVKRDEKAIN